MHLEFFGFFWEGNAYHQYWLWTCTSALVGKDAFTNKMCFQYISGECRGHFSATFSTQNISKTFNVTLRRKVHSLSYCLPYCEAQGKGRARGRPRKVTQRSFMDGGWWMVVYLSLMLYTKFGCHPPPPTTTGSLNKCQLGAMLGSWR